jgi:hypothetical protein
VLLVLSLAYFVYLGRAGYSTDVQWLAGARRVTDLAGNPLPYISVAASSSEAPVRVRER